MPDEQPAWDTRLKAYRWAPGNYTCICIQCGKEHAADKRAMRCGPCARALLDASTTKVG